MSTTTIDCSTQVALTKRVTLDLCAADHLLLKLYATQNRTTLKNVVIKALRESGVLSESEPELEQ